MNLDTNKLNPLCKSVMNSDIMNEVKLNRLTYEYQMNDDVISKDIISTLLLCASSADTYLMNYYSDEHISSFFDFLTLAIKDNITCLKYLIGEVNEEYVDKERFEDIKFALMVYDDMLNIMNLKKEFDDFDTGKLDELVSKSNKTGIFKILNKKNKEKADALDQSYEKLKNDLRSAVDNFQTGLFNYLTARNKSILEKSFVKKED